MNSISSITKPRGYLTMIYKPTLKQIKECMYRQYNYGGEDLVHPEETPINWFFTVYIPIDIYNLNIETEEELQGIFDFWKAIRIACNLGDTYNLIDSLTKLKKKRFYCFYDCDIYECYDWFVLLGICVANNFIVDSNQIDYCESASVIYDIEPATPRLKVRIP